MPAGRIAFDSSIICVARSGARTDGCAWGSARLKLDLVAISLALVCSLQCTCAGIEFLIMFATVRTLARGCCGVRMRVRADLEMGGDMTPEALTAKFVGRNLHTTMIEATCA